MFGVVSRFGGLNSLKNDEMMRLRSQLHPTVGQYGGNFKIFSNKDANSVPIALYQWAASQRQLMHLISTISTYTQYISLTDSLRVQA